MKREHLILRWKSLRDAIDGWAFGPRLTPATRLREILTTIALVAIGAVISFVRIPPPARNLLWAEDASVFVGSALEHRPDAALFEPYAGYMHAFPRLITALTVSLVPLDVVPVVLTAAACVLTAVIATAAVLALRSRVPSFAIRLVVWAGIVTLPVAGIEANGSVANSHWYLLVGLFVVLITRRQDSGYLILAGLIVAFAVLSDPLSIVFVPLVIARFLSLRGLRDLWIPAIYCAALVVQLTVVLSTSVASAAGHPTLVQALRTTGFRVFLAALAGESGSVSLYLDFHAKAIALATFVVALLVVVALVRGRQLGGLALISTVAGTAFFLGAAVIRWNEQYDPFISTTWGGSRYSVVPICLLLFAFAATASTWYSAGWRVSWVRFVAPVAFAALVVALAIPAFTVTARHATTSWDSELRGARSTCATSGDAHVVKLYGAPHNFYLTATCAELGY